MLLAACILVIRVKGRSPRGSFHEKNTLCCRLCHLISLFSPSFWGLQMMEGLGIELAAEEGRGEKVSGREKGKINSLELSREQKGTFPSGLAGIQGMEKGRICSQTSAWNKKSFISFLPSGRSIRCRRCTAGRGAGPSPGPCPGRRRSPCCRQRRRPWPSPSAVAV